MECRACGHENRLEARFCDACGAPLGRDAGGLRAAPGSYTPEHLAKRILTLRSALEGERKQVTVLFCDIADSTALAQRLGAEAMHTVLNQFFELALDAVHEVEGTINQFLGDGFMALFGAPLAHEDHVRRALAAALALARRLAEAAQQPGSRLSQLRVRIGINTGAVVVGKIGDNLRMDYTAVGDTTNIAARLQALATPGQVCVSEAVRHAGSAHFEFEPLGDHALKGVSERVRVHRLVRAAGRGGGAGALGIASELVGRDAELAVAAAAIDDLQHRRGGVLMVVGEPGVGKSRLLAELRRRHADRLAWLEGRTLSFGRNLSYWPFIEILKGVFGIADDEGEDAGFARLEQGLTGLLGDRAADALPYVATVLTLKLPAALRERVGYLDGPSLKRQVFVSMRQVFDALASRRPTLLLLEDWHWADPSSIELAEHLLPLTATLPLLMVFPTRPGTDDPAARTQQIAATVPGLALRSLVLSALTGVDSTQLVDNLVGRNALPAALREQILRKSEGNPLFIEEVVRSLASDGVLARDAAGHWQLTRQPERVTLPDTLHALILARIDRLDEEVKHALKLASVIGRSFFDSVLEAILDAQSHLPDSLAELEHAELIRQKQRAPEAEHIFKHALIQEATYGSILAENRRSIHGQVARAIERLFPDRLDEFASLLAHHYTAAEDWSKAQEYLFKAGDQAGRMASDMEALEHLRRAEAAYVKAFGDRLAPLQRATLGRKIGAALFGTGHNEQAHAQMRAALAHLGIEYPTTRPGVRREILRQLARHLLRTLRRKVGLPAPRLLDAAVAEEISTLAHHMSWVDYFVDKERMLLDCLIEMMAGENSGFALAESRGTAAVGFGWMTFGALRLARRYHRRATAIAQASGHPAAVSFSWFVRGFADYYDGRWDLCELRLGKAAQLYRESGDLHRAGGGLLMQALVTHARGGVASTRATGEALVRTGENAADPQLVSWGHQIVGYPFVDTGPLPEAEAWLRRGCELAARIPAWDNHNYQASQLAKCLVLQGRAQEAMGVVADMHQVLKREHLRLPFDRIEVLTAEATARLALAEQAAAAGDGPARQAQLRELQAVCRDMLRTARRMPRFLVEALRLQGNADWLTGRQTAARRCWREALALAERWAFPVERARVLLDSGLRTGEAALVAQGEAMLRQTGALSYLPRTTAERDTDRAGTPVPLAA